MTRTLTLGDRVTHTGYGAGTVTVTESAGKVTVRFDRQSQMWNQRPVILPTYTVTHSN